MNGSGCDRYFKRMWRRLIPGHDVSDYARYRPPCGSSGAGLGVQRIGSRFSVIGPLHALGNIADRRAHFQTGIERKVLVLR